MRHKAIFASESQVIVSKGFVEQRGSQNSETEAPKLCPGAFHADRIDGM
jgi:hypothetical protein